MTLSLQQKAFIDFYCGEAEFKAQEAARLAGYSQPARAGYEVLKSKKVAEAIQDRLDTRARTAWYSQEDIQKALWEEVHTKEGRGNTQAARVSALVWLGKCIGMWSDVEQKAKLLEEQKKQPSIQFNVINYSSEKNDKVITQESIESEIEKSNIDIKKGIKSLQDLNVINYSEDN